MKLRPHFQAWKTFSIFLLAACLLLLSIGARSISFHQWFHGDDVHCSLVLETGLDDHDQDSSHEDHHFNEDPLSPFCITGSLDLAFSSSILVLPPCVETMPTFLYHASIVLWTQSAPTRAPPAWV